MMYRDKIYQNDLVDFEIIYDEITDSLMVPLSGYDKEKKTFWMELSNKKLTTTLTSNGFVTVFPNGETMTSLLPTTVVNIYQYFFSDDLDFTMEELIAYIREDLAEED